MIKIKVFTLIFVILSLATVLSPTKVSAAAGEKCTPNSSSLFGLPTWYKFLPGKEDSKGSCIPTISGCEKGDDRSKDTCEIQSGVDASKIWLIALAVVDILLRLGGMLAVVIVIFAGFKYITSQGNPESTKSSRGTIIGAFVGIVIIVIASVSVGFIARLLQQ